MNNLRLTVTATGMNGLYHLEGLEDITHKSYRAYADGDPLVQTLTSGLAQVPWLSYVRKSNEGKSKDIRLEITVQTDSIELRRTAMLLATAEDPTDLSSEAQALHDELLKFDVKWTDAEGDAADLRSWVIGATAGGAR